MSPQWLLFVSLAVLGSVFYNTGVKLGAGAVNPIGFMISMTSLILILMGICFLTAKYGFNVEVTKGLNARTLRYVALSACGATLTNICIFLAMHYGSAISSQVFWAVGSIVAFALCAVLFLGDLMTWTKALGIVFGIVSVLLITKVPS